MLWIWIGAALTLPYMQFNGVTLHCALLKSKQKYRDLHEKEDNL